MNSWGQTTESCNKSLKHGKSHKMKFRFRDFYASILGIEKFGDLYDKIENSFCTSALGFNYQLDAWITFKWSVIV